MTLAGTFEDIQERERGEELEEGKIGVEPSQSSGPHLGPAIDALNTLRQRLLDVDCFKILDVVDESDAAEPAAAQRLQNSAEPLDRAIASCREALQLVDTI
ncbi:MAG: hypothetical protein M1830_007597 [Pleopsidium flavum]|nr:MAG: hypothetical protein M1830_007607 [Pleopsidium flavum]KAI9875992.1 MAG: hypothetical protein M1830_007597 [Pleopsidium flavum]